MLSSLNLNFYYDGQFDTKVVSMDEKVQLRSNKYRDGGSVWWHDDYKKKWRQITSHFFDLKDARKEYYWYCQRQYE